MECGCVAGFYIANNTDGDRCGEESMQNDPTCSYIDVMEASKYGFATRIHPCNGDSCEPIECFNEIEMKDQGEGLYGLDAYGPEGTYIDTNLPFTVHVAFICDKGYDELWSVQTTLKQNGKKMILKAYCPGEFGHLNKAMDGKMGLILSSWDNRNARTDSIETGNKCQIASTCNTSMATFSEINIKQWGYNWPQVKPKEWIDPHPEPEP